MTFEFTPAQRALIESESGGFFEACPGAGKTQTIVERFATRADTENSRRGVALITFTNAAAEEAQRRCSHKPELLQAPNFVGTIDSFINRFFAAPFYKARFCKTPTFWDSWSSLDSAVVTIKGQAPAPLDDFICHNDRATLLDKYRWKYKHYPIRVLESAAHAKWKELTKAGHLDADTSRLLARIEIEENRYGIVELLATRFEEVIVDEVQDCNTVDLLVLRTLQESGIRLITVGDIDQSIYEFRGTSVAEVRNFVDSRDRQPRINTNFRSSPAICKIVDSLREGTSTDTAGGRASSCEIPVHLVGYRETSDIGPSVKAVMDQYQELSQPVFLAHKGDNAALAAGGRAKKKTSANKVAVLAGSCNELLYPSSTSAQRTRALIDIGLSLQRLHPDRGLAKASEERYLESLGLTKSAYRELCLRFAVAAGDPTGLSRGDFREKVVQVADKFGVALDRDRTKTPLANVWIWDGVPTAENQYEHSTIHGFKGLETDSVVLIIPGDNWTGDTIRDWSEDQSSEARRVLYVGASRAERLLILAVHSRYIDAVKAILERDAVPLALSR
ncbi:UvrD-helicase domain-containing protein [Corynebacterium sp. HMSC05D03]|uniref:UvrD-helicase domain-containing protein n=1 Tax=Corynebacterium sp. HMSC05D03 TaxID=1581115 RepID=UPI0008A477E1|nr:UvrD-helicase domain-containing protein [Corynebacterium sp. HMSC05D03]OFT64454.1 DNA/RNA helicase [Corynebacterium sp. HMSC05D03]